MKKEFNITGLCIPEKHYMIDISERINEIINMIEGEKYFTINRPRQYGKTTTLNLLYRELSKKYSVIISSFEYEGEVLFASEESFCSRIFNKFADDIDMVDEELLHKMAKAGCWQISYGIETGNTEIMNRLQKKITRDTILSAIAQTKKSGIRTVGYFMIGHFGETESTVQETMHFACSSGLDDMRMSFFTPLPGTLAYEQAYSFGEFEDEWEKMTLFAPVFVPKGMTKEQLIQLHRKVHIVFYLRPRIIWSYIKILRNPQRIIEAVGIFIKFVRSNHK